MTAVRRLFFLLLYLSWAWHCWSLKLGTPLGQGRFSHTVCSTLAPRQFFPPGPGLQQGTKPGSAPNLECSTSPLLPALLCPLPQTLLRMETQQKSLQQMSSLQVKYQRSSSNCTVSRVSRNKPVLQITPIHEIRAIPHICFSNIQERPLMQHQN